MTDRDSDVPADGYRTLPRASLHAMYLTRAIVVAVLVVAVCSYILFVDDGTLSDWIPAIAAVLVLLAAYCAVSPVVYFRHYRFRIDDDEIDVRSGVIVLTHTLVPVERVHQVEVSRGPIDRHYGLASVTVTTAGGTFDMPHLSDEDAEDIARRLNDIIVRMLRSRERWRTGTATIRWSSPRTPSRRWSSRS